MTSRKPAPVLWTFLILTIFASLFSHVNVCAASSRHLVKKVWYSNDTVKIFIETAKPGTKPGYKYNMIDGNRFYIDVVNSRVKTNLNSSINLDDVLAIRRAQFDPNTSRVVIHFNKKGIKPKVTYVNGSSPFILVSWNGKTVSYSKRKIKILIDPGHGGRDTGAIGPVRKTKEKDVALDIALKLEKLLQKKNDFIIELTRRTDTTIRPSARRAMAYRWNPDIFISIHANSSPYRNSSLNQTEIYYYDKKSMPFARIVRDELIDELERSNGHIRREPFTVIFKNPATYGSVLVESCYISSKIGENFLRQDWYRQEIAKGLFNSIDTFFNMVD